MNKIQYGLAQLEDQIMSLRFGVRKFEFCIWTQTQLSNLLSIIEECDPDRILCPSLHDKITGRNGRQYLLVKKNVNIVLLCQPFPKRVHSKLTNTSQSQVSKTVLGSITTDQSLSTVALHRTAVTSAVFSC